MWFMEGKRERLIIRKNKRMKELGIRYGMDGVWFGSRAEQHPPPSSFATITITITITAVDGALGQKGEKEKKRIKEK